MHREIEIRDNIRNTKSRLRLVYPREDTVTPDAVSVLTPLGVALIGLSAGDSIEWCTLTGDRRSVTILRTLRP
jgi:regulator of nucleoside diphosphate kinase